ncbi:MAG: tetratricopeptide repeat protein [Bacteroidaceae bacterium]|nr:tetratricopeptide repeat protein [Bacteroidaceae bacterium]
MAKKQKTKVSDQAIGLDVQLNKSEAFLEKNWKVILAAIVAVIVVVAGIFIYRNHKAAMNAEASTAMAKSEAAFGMEQYEQALNGNGADEVGFLKIIDEYSGTKAANLAKAYAGLCYVNLDNTDEAIKMLESFDPQDDQFISPSAIAALGNCYATKGDRKMGAETVVKAAKRANNDAMSPIFMMQAAQLYESLNQNDKALELYKQIKDNYSRSSLANDIDKYIERVSK